MALKRHPWYTDLVLATMERSGELIIGFVIANLPYIQHFRSRRAPTWPWWGTCGTPTWSWSPWRGHIYYFYVVSDLLVQIFELGPIDDEKGKKGRWELKPSEWYAAPLCSVAYAKKKIITNAYPTEHGFSLSLSNLFSICITQCPYLSAT